MTFDRLGGKSVRAIASPAGFTSLTNILQSTLGFAATFLNQSCPSIVVLEVEPTRPKAVAIWLKANLGERLPERWLWTHPR